MDSAMDRAHLKLPALSVEVAVELLSVHSFSCEDHTDPRMENGLLASLRAYNGQLNHRAFHEVMACIKAIGPGLSEGEMVLRRPLSDLWGIYHLGICYLGDPNRQKRRSEILKPSEVELESLWLDCIGYAVMIYLQFDDADEAFTLYEDVCKCQPPPLGEDCLGSAGEGEQ